MAVKSTIFERMILRAAGQASRSGTTLNEVMGKVFSRLDERATSSAGAAQVNKFRRQYEIFDRGLRQRDSRIPLSPEGRPQPSRRFDVNPQGDAIPMSRNRQGGYEPTPPPEPGPMDIIPAPQRQAPLPALVPESPFIDVTPEVSAPKVASNQGLGLPDDWWKYAAGAAAGATIWETFDREDYSVSSNRPIY